MERDDLASVAGIFHDATPLERGAVVRLDEQATHHLRVRRVDAGERVYLCNGAGARAIGSVARIGKKEADVAIDDVVTLLPPPAVHLLVPVADRDRMMWCAEKCVELGAASWRPVLWNRSRSVSPRGEGEAFGSRIRARMTSALIQSHGAWLPEMLQETSLAAAIDRLPDAGVRLSLEQGGSPIAAVAVTGPVTIAVGPEGGMEPPEREILHRAGFRPVSLGANVLRFETAAVAALAIVRSKLDGIPETTNG